MRHPDDAGEFGHRAHADRRPDAGQHLRREIEVPRDAFCALDDGARAAWLGWAVARTLHAVPDGMTGSGFLNHLGAKLRIDVKAWWRPTARNFFDRITKPAILGLFEAMGGSELKSRYAASRKFDLAASAEKLFAGQIIAEAETKERAVAWLPGPMRFAAEDSRDEASLFEAADASDDPAQPEPVAEPETGEKPEGVEQDREEPVELPEAA